MAEEILYPQEQEQQDAAKVLIALTKKQGGKKILVPSLEGYETGYNVDGIYVSDGIHAVILSLTESQHPWGGNSVDLAEGDPLYDAGCNSLQSFDGEWLTDFLIKMMHLTEGTAMVEAKKEGWLPAGGELTMIMANKDEVNSLLEIVGGEQLNSEHYWTSSKFSDERAYSYDMERGLFNLRKGNVNALAVRPVKSSAGYVETENK